MGLTAEQIKTRLQIFQGCASLMARNYVYGLKRGKDCSDELCKLGMLLSYVDAIRGYQPTTTEASLDSVASFYVNDDITFKVGEYYLNIYLDQTFLYGEFFSPDNFPDFVTELVAIFENAGFIITYETNPVGEGILQYTFTVVANCCNNGKTLGVEMNVIDEGQYTNSDTFSGGVCYNNYKNCLTEEQVLNILHKMKKICNDSPLKYIENYV